MLIKPTRRDILAAGGGAAAAAMLPSDAWARTPLTGWARAADIVRRVQPPRFPARTVSIVAHGAKGDGVTKATAAIAAAIDAVALAGGGRVLVPAGRFLTGAIHLKSNVELHLADDATLLFSTDTADYPVVHTRWEGVDVMGYSPLVYAYRQKNIAITGKGTLDGQASDKHWWSWKGPGWRGSVDHGWREGMPHQKPARAKLFQMAEDGVPVSQRVFADGAYLRPPMISPYGCENVFIEGVRMRRAPFWHIHPVLCRNVVVRGVDMLSHGPNCDGCNPESVAGMVIEDCVFDTGDDCIAVDSGRNNEGRRIGVPAEDIVIRRCRMKEGHGGLVIGSVISGGVRNVFAEDCHLGSPNLSTAIRFKNNAARGGLLEHLYYRNITVSEVHKAVIECDFNYEEGPKGDFTPVLRHVWIDRLTATNAVRVADLQGLPRAPISDIRVTNSRFTGVTKQSTVAYVDDLKLEKVTVNGKPTDKL